MNKYEILPLEKMNQQQQLVYEMLKMGDRSFDDGFPFTRSNLTRRRLCERLNSNDANSRKVVKSLLPFVPVVASKGYFIASSITEIDRYVDSLNSKIKGLENTINYLKVHRKKMVSSDESNLL